MFRECVRWPPHAYAARLAAVEMAKEVPVRLWGRGRGLIGYS